MPYSSQRNKIDSGLEMLEIHYGFGKKSFGILIINNLLTFQFLSTSCGVIFFFFFSISNISITAT